MAITRISILPYLNDFLYHVLYSATPNEKKQMPRRYLPMVKTHTKAMAFANKSQLEEKLEVFESLGIGWFLTLFDNSKNKLRTIGQLFEEFKPDEKDSHINKIVERRMYIASDRQFVYNQGLLADSTNHKIFSQNLLLEKAGYNLHKWKKKMKGTETDFAKENKIVSKYITELIVQTLVQADYLEGLLEMTKNDFKILGYLYSRDNTYVPYDEILEKFGGHLSRIKVTGCVRRLSQNQFIQKTPKANLKEYQITATGIKAIATFWRQILKANTF